MSFKAEIVADSICNGRRITSMLVTFPRMILAEFNTHRMFSRNSASSRAIPFNRMLEMVQSNPFIPIAWMKDHKGMQGTEYLSREAPMMDGSDIQFLSPHDGARNLWLKARNAAIDHALYLSAHGVTKQLCNRLLEPFMWHTALVTATEWENFFALRLDPGAEIHMQEIARLMLEAMNASTPKELEPGEWHIPFGDQIDEPRLLGEWMISSDSSIEDEEFEEELMVLTRKIATARCARVSYTTFDGKPEMHDYVNDIKLHDRLLAAGHMSPFEHCAQAMELLTYDTESFNADDGDEGTWGWSGNFHGWIQYRKIFSSENRSDSRLLKK